MLEKQSGRLITPILAWFLVGMVLANVSGSMIQGLLPVYIADDLGATVGQVGLVFTLSAIMPLALQILGGWLSDTIGRLRTIAIGSIAGTVGNVGMVFAPTWQWLVIALMIGGIARAMVGPSFAAFIADQSSEEQRGRVFGVSNGIFFLVNVIGPPLGGYIGLNFGFEVLLPVVAALYAIAAVLRIGMAIKFRHSGKQNDEPLTLVSLRNNLLSMISLLTAGGILTWILISDGIRDIAFELSIDLFPLYMERIGGLNLTEIGWEFSIFGIAIVLTTLLSGWLADRFDERVPIITGYVVSGAALMLMTRGEDFIGFAIPWALAGFGFGLLNPAYDSIVSKATPENMRGIAFGLFQTSLGIFSLPAPFIGAKLWETFSPQVPFIVSALGMLLIVLPVWLKFKLPQQEEVAEPLIA